MKKVPAVADVHVTLKGGLTVLELKPGNDLTIARIRQILRNGGYPTREATVIALGSVSADAKTFVVSGTNEQLTATAAPQKVDDRWRFVVPAPPE